MEAMETTTALVDMEGKEEFSANLDTADTAMEVEGTVMATVTAMELERAMGTDMATATEAVMATATEAARVMAMATEVARVMATDMEVERATATEIPTATVAERCLTAVVTRLAVATAVVTARVAAAIISSLRFYPNLSKAYVL